MANERPSEAKVNLAIFASGTGSNADKICAYFKDHSDIHVELIVSNSMNAGVLEVASNHEIESVVIPKQMWNDADNLLPILDSQKITHIILAGFLVLLPSWIINRYEGRILNIHPALLPKYGGKGMYGSHVHQQVKIAGDLVSGITIHEVNENYDEGNIIFQVKISLDPDDSPSEIGNKVLQLEHYHYPRVIEQWAKNSLNP